MPDSELFQSTPSVGRATADKVGTRRYGNISIHALRGEGDFFVFLLDARGFISIHALRGEGDLRATEVLLKLAISIHALRGEGDRHARKITVEDRISIHALRGEGDPSQTARPGQSTDFNPRPPWGGRPEQSAEI